MSRKIVGAVAGLVFLAAAGGGIAVAAGAGSGASRMDDGKQYLTAARISEQQAIDAAQAKVSGDLNEIDLEHVSGRLVFNVDVGSHDVKVDAGSGEVVSVDSDD